MLFYSWCCQNYFSNCLSSFKIYYVTSLLFPNCSILLLQRFLPSENYKSEVYVFSRLIFLSLGSNKMVLFTIRDKNLRGMNLLAPKWFFSFDEEKLFWVLDDFASASVDMVCFQATQTA